MSEKSDNFTDDEAIISSSSGGSSAECPSCTPTSNAAPVIPNGLLQRASRRIAHRPWTFLVLSFIVALTIGIIGLTVGNFSIEANNSGWTSRGTTIANRHTQNLLIRWNRDYLQTGGEEAWIDLTTNVQSGWETDDDDDDGTDRRRMSDVEMQAEIGERFGTRSDSLMEDEGVSRNDIWRNLRLKQKQKQKQNQLQTDLESDRNLQDMFGECDFSWYFTSMTEEAHLWPVWRTTSPTTSALDPDIIYDLCISEEKTKNHLERKGLCYGCGEDDSECLPPFGLVLFARVSFPNGLKMNCTELSTQWSTIQEEKTEELRQCVRDTKELFNTDSKADLMTMAEFCPTGFHPALVDDDFDETGVVSYTSTVFSTVNDPEALFDEVSSFDRGSDRIQAVYDTQYEDFVYIQIDSSLMNDFALATGSAAVTAVAILVHTRSPFLTFVGLLQIILSFPVAYFIYSLIGRLDFFPLLNFIGIFVVFALGADDIFVAVDKWKNARIEYRTLSTEEIAAIALPDATNAMFLTTITTAVAFFGTAICPVAPVKCFAVFCGLLIVVDYIMCLLLVFPALVIYDQWKDRKNCCMSCHCCRQLADEQSDDKPSLIRRILLAFYRVLHAVRWPLLLGLAAVFGVCVYYSTQMQLPTSSDVRLLSSKFQYERNFEWRQNILFDKLIKDAGSNAYVQFGTLAEDTGIHTSPNSFSQLVLDDQFDPKSQEAQTFLLEFCPRFFNESFADKTDEDYECSINKFHEWLKFEAEMYANTSIASLEWMDSCNGADGLPMNPNDFHPCMSAWAELENDKNVFVRNGKVKIMYLKFNSRIRYDSPFSEIDEEWKSIERWMENEREDSPADLGEFYHTSFHFWWYDTNHQMLKTAYASAGIALAVAGLVILFSSRSLILTAFSVLSIGFVLTSVTAMVFGYGWTLGFLESICFAILIGISCDFVIHFSHAYAVQPGAVSKSERTKYALIRMGPSILAAAFTTISAAIIMLFCVITFFEKFALILLFTILQATVGSFVVFITLADCFGPSQPTAFVDLLLVKISSWCGRCKRKKLDDEHVRENEKTSPRASTGGEEMKKMEEDSFVENDSNTMKDS